MIKEVEVSISSDVTSRGKKIAVYLLDAVSAFFIFFFLLLGSLAIYTSLDSYKKDNESIDKYVKDISTLVIESKLSRLKVHENGEQELLSVDEMALSFTNHLFYDGAVLLDESYGSLDTFKDVNSKEQDDVLYFYFSNFYPNNKDKYKEFNSHYNVAYYQNNLLKLIDNETNNYIVKENSKLTINPQTVKEYIGYLNKENKNGINAYNLIKKSYATTLNDTIKDYANNFMPYVELSNKYDEVLSKQDNELLIIVICSYSIGILSYYLLFPLLFREGRTPFMKLFKVTYKSNDMQNPKYYQTVIKTFIIFFLLTPFTLISSFIVFGLRVGLSILMTDFFGIFNLFAIGTLMSLFLVCSLFFTFFKKDKKQTFSDALSGLYMYDVITTTKLEIGSNSYEIRQK